MEADLRELIDRVRGLATRFPEFPIDAKEADDLCSIAEASLDQRAKFVADVRRHLRCNCNYHGYDPEGRTYPSCLWHTIAVELLTEEEFAGLTGK